MGILVLSGVVGVIRGSGRAPYLHASSSKAKASESTLASLPDIFHVNGACLPALLVAFDAAVRTSKECGVALIHAVCGGWCLLRGRLAGFGNSSGKRLSPPSQGVAGQRRPVRYLRCMDGTLLRA